ncbi:hypothetical protein FZ983_33515 [Azospirillum sp. B21]|uniref:hypothetical protein n=1 Tax=Azospirillum sp. B21 TaxID=2607496 RepID=UPI0011EFC5C0|nr:hypothetical protein [Azospirillum sp. B21]KAA0571309.1 hypothetical protein FZ983_33515 [Azospirillum sp. B21]
MRTGQRPLAGLALARTSTSTTSATGRAGVILQLIGDAGVLAVLVLTGAGGAPVGLWCRCACRAASQRLPTGRAGGDPAAGRR